MSELNDIGTNTPLSWCKSKSKRLSSSKANQQQTFDYNQKIQLQFENEKRQTLNKMDKSVKGEIDTPIVDIVEMINNSLDYYTTSSCSGRIIVTGTGIESTSGGQNNKLSSETTTTTSSKNKPNVVNKKGLDWNFVSHEAVGTSEQQSQFLEQVFGSSSSCNPHQDQEHRNTFCPYSSMWLKFEPFILHVRCCSLESARQMLQVGMSSGFRNSGIMLSSNGHQTVAIRCTASLEVPLAIDGRFIVDKTFLLQILKIANKKMDNNFEMIEQFKRVLSKQLQQANSKLNQIDDNQELDENIENNGNFLLSTNSS